MSKNIQTLAILQFSYLSQNRSHSHDNWSQSRANMLGRIWWEFLQKIYPYKLYKKVKKKKLKVGPVMTNTSNGSNENRQNVHSKYLHTWNNVLNSKVRIQNSAEFCHFSSSCYPNFSLVITKKSHISRHQIRTSTTWNSSQKN